MKKLFLISLISLSTFAHEDCRQLDLAEQLLSFIPAKECPSIDEVLLKRAEDEYKKNYGGLPIVNKSVNGFKLSGSQEEIDLAILMLGKKPPSKWNAAAASCDTVICAFTKLYEGSKESALQLFNISAKSNYHLSLDQTINSDLAEQIWSPGEIRDVHAAISKLPPELARLDLKKIDRLADNLRINGHGPLVGAFARPKGFSNEGKLVVYDTGMKKLTTGDPAKGSSWPQEVIVHELCHHHDFKGYYGKARKMISEQMGSEFAKLSGWKEVTNIKGESEWQKSNDQFVSWYSETSPAEDYAESCMNYLLHPKTLKEKAPEKYAYMKNNLFNGREFLGMPWSVDASKQWPALAEKLKDQAACGKKIAECSARQMFYSFQSIEAQLQLNECFKKFKNDELAAINTELGEDPKYCELGGTNAVSKAGEQFCGDTIKSVSQAVDKLKKIDFGPAIKACESTNDFSESCVIDSASSDVNLAPEMISLIPRMLDGKIPDRMTALGNKAAELPSASWLTACTRLAKSIDVFIGESGGKKSLYASYINQTGKSTFLGRFLHKDYNQNDMNKDCAQSALKEFEKAGVKIPQSGMPAKIMQKPFVDELESFHKEVLASVKNVQKNCIASTCKDKKVLELLQSWEMKNKSRRSGIATKEYAKELRAKIK